ncbi:hypothetical protein MKZ17_03770 [Solibacillus sp. FSL R7-0682]|uniref:hypothetical protein n=1 Tax=Solibacillus sp. FSL R7-0682 TaxID=2921690 RepID=UPI0030F7C063
MSRYNEQLDVYNATKAAHGGKTVNYRVLENGLRQRLANGEITKDDVAVAFDVAKRLQTDQARVMYASVKRAAESIVEETPDDTPDNEEQPTE